jgi:hypothetical protein
MMKKALILCCFALATFAADAQISIAPGVRGGVNFSKFTNSDTDMKTDFFIGGSVAVKFSKLYTLQPELTYSRQGAKEHFYLNTDVVEPFDPVIINRRIENKYQLDYLSLAIINKFTFGQGFQVMVGPSFDFKVSDNFRSFGLESPQDFDVSLVAGIGFALKNGLAFDARIKQGFVDIFGYDRLNYTDNGNNNYYYDGYTVDDVVLNQVIQIGVSYTFKMK